MFFKILQKLNFKKNFPYFFCTPLIYGIGTASDEISTAAAYAKISKKKLLLFKTTTFKGLLNYKVCNNALYDSLIINNQESNKNFLYQVIDFFIQLEFVIRRILAISLKKIFKYDIGESFRFATIGTQDFFSEKKLLHYNKILPLSIKEGKIDLGKKNKEQCLKMLKLNGFQDKKFVCLHVRDGGYYKDGDRRSYRNSNINNYIGLIELLINKGYFVFRIGDNSASKINYENKNFINYPFTELKSEIMDLYLVKECTFYVGTPSGPYTTADLFDKPVFLTNVNEFYSAFPRKKFDRAISKKMIIKKTGEILSIKDFARLNIHYHETEVDIGDIHFEENTSEELCEAMNEYLNLIDNIRDLKNKKVFFHKNQTELNKFLSLTLEKKYNEQVKKQNYFKNDHWKQSQFLRIVKRFKSCEGTFISSFLKKNF